MDTNNKPNRIHPLVAIAAVSVTVLSLAGVAAITGLLPTSHSESGPANAPVASLMAPAANSASAAQAAPGVSSDSAQAKTAADTASTKTQLANNEAEKPAPKAASKTTTQHRSTPRPASQNYSQQTAQARAICYDCGRIEAVTPVQEQGQGSGVGVVAGAVVGGLLGNQVGGGNGRKLATVAGAVGGGFAGNEVEKRARATSSYRVSVRMEDGSTRSFKETTDNWRVGDRVRIVNGQLTLRG
ncbi:outer membrane lipoprotein SlyB [Paucimonas lemoignei]|uniref:Outer membrane lipoprotein SlyB n=1 Tax=Paucimonas lemoignei TaxID=29443 RepID=A0A4R3HSE0_PAULE|nr:glycine zipper 2TM domain-containing protein [Paucimonas lemoignei]TCS35858.1 outer membrane lipoprotein SlyB [Paucimonas lemoignei]